MSSDRLIQSMKNIFNKIILLFVVFLSCNKMGYGQDRIRQKPCFDSSMQKQADSLKVLLTEQGFIMVHEATMTMVSEYEMPVIVPLREGTWYRIVFIGDSDSKLYEIRMYDWSEKQVKYEKHFGWGEQSNVINYRFIPQASQYFVIKPVQVSKKKGQKDLCGYIMLFKKVK